MKENCMKIFIIDDCRGDLERATITTKEVFEDAEISVFDDEGLAFKAIEKDIPDLIIMDIILKREHGYAMCNKIKGISPNIPIILLTSSLNAIDSHLAEKSGASGFAIKTRTMESFKQLLIVFKKNLLQAA